MSFGQELQFERERRQISLQSMADRTGVPIEFLTTFEQEPLGRLPEDVSAAAILQCYCRDLGLDEREWISRLNTLPADQAANEQTAERDAESSARMALRWWGVLLMLLLLGALAWAAWKYVVQPRVREPPATSARAAACCSGVPLPVRPVRNDWVE